MVHEGDWIGSQYLGANAEQIVLLNIQRERKENEGNERTHPLLGLNPLQFLCFTISASFYTRSEIRDRSQRRGRQTNQQQHDTQTAYVLLRKRLPNTRRSCTRKPIPHPICSQLTRRRRRKCILGTRRQRLSRRSLIRSESLFDGEIKSPASASRVLLPFCHYTLYPTFAPNLTGNTTLLFVCSMSLVSSVSLFSESFLGEAECLIHAP